MESLTLSWRNRWPGCGAGRWRANRGTAPWLARLLDEQLDRCVGLHQPPATVDHRAHLIVDLAGVRNFAGGLLVVRHAQHPAELADIGLHLTGLAILGR